LKGVILAGGKGTRLYPLTKIINKHLLPVGQYPMIHYSINALKLAGIKDILIITDKQSSGLYTEYLGSGRDWDLNISFRIQEDSGGIAQALALADGFIQPREKFVMVLGDNLFEDSLKDQVKIFSIQKTGARVMLKEVEDPSRYGVPTIVDDKIVEIEEKPENPKSNYCVTGIYMYDSDVFEIIRNIQPSKRGEMEITDVNNIYAKQGRLTFDILKGWWTDAGTFNSLYEAGARFLYRREENP
jgi:glucose-1-phosphate thymidylyltransferase